MSNIIGYLCSGPDGLNVESLLDQLNAAGATRIFREQLVNTKQKRPQLDKLMAEVNCGDIVVVTSLDQIARNIRPLLEMIESLEAAGASLKVISHDLDTSAARGVVVRTLRAIADFERQTARQNQAAGIAKAKREGRYKGRKPTAMAKAAEVMALNGQKLTRQEIADQLGIGVASVYRILKNQGTMQKKEKRQPSRTIETRKPVDRPARDSRQELVDGQKPDDKRKRARRKPKNEPDTGQLSFF